jgi:peptide-methionine (R)-S-oxide reductase
LNKTCQTFIVSEKRLKMKNFLKLLLLPICIVFCTNCNQAQTTPPKVQKPEISAPIEMPNPKTMGKIEKSEESWQAQLGQEAFRVLRKAGTERAFTGTYWDKKEAGIYCCAGCRLPLFASDTKYDSGSGWPSFYQPLKKGYVEEHADRSLGMLRTEVLCARCGGHLGHVFEDGPKPTGLRYCINSVSLEFVPVEKPKEK